MRSSANFRRIRGKEKIHMQDFTCIFRAAGDKIAIEHAQGKRKFENLGLEDRNSTACLCFYTQGCYARVWGLLATGAASFQSS